RQKLSQAEIGDRVGIKQATISAFENNPEGTKLETLFKLFSALDLEIQIIPKEESVFLNKDGKKNGKNKAHQ
ncbi:MAG: helix-turn-helix domain-containing protein, partial [Pseudanabaena sp.]